MISQWIQSHSSTNIFCDILKHESSGSLRNCKFFFFLALIARMGNTFNMFCFNVIFLALALWGEYLLVILGSTSQQAGRGCLNRIYRGLWLFVLLFLSKHIELATSFGHLCRRRATTEKINKGTQKLNVGAVISSYPLVPKPLLPPPLPLALCPPLSLSLPLATCLPPSLSMPPCLGSTPCLPLPADQSWVSPSWVVTGETQLYCS